MNSLDSTGEIKPGGRGGKRVGAGRKPGLTRQRLQDLHEQMAHDARAAFDFVAETLRDEDAPLKLRLQAAELLMNRAWGKPRQGIDLTTRDLQPAVDPEAQVRLLTDPEACELACDLDSLLASPQKDGKA